MRSRLSGAGEQIVNIRRRNLAARRASLLLILSASSTFGLAGCGGPPPFDRETACESANGPQLPEGFSIQQSKSVQSQGGGSPDSLSCELDQNGRKVGTLTIKVGPEENRGMYRQECYPANAWPGLDRTDREEVENNVDEQVTACRYLDENAFQIESASNRWTAVARVANTELFADDRTNTVLGSILMRLLAKSHFAGNNV